MHELVVTSIAILGLPLLSFVLVIFNQRTLRLRAHLIGVTFMTFGLLLAIYTAFIKLKGLPNAAIEWNFNWISFGDVPGLGPLSIQLGVMVDNLTAIMLVVVMLVSALVHLYSIQYMRGDVRYARYFAYLGLFTFSMVGIVITNTLFGMYMFWELVGFSSYALIGHWYEQPAPQRAAKKAFIVNRIGDVAMWTGLMTIFATLHTFTFSEIFDAVSHGLPAGFSILGMSPADTLSVAGVLIFCGAIGKSAQFPLHVWLPDAMEGPTPVSALIHAATMVAAGVYLLARIFPILTADASFIIACVGGITALLGALMAITQTDVKRVLAYSTISQLGYMVMAMGAGAFTAGFFHLVTHAMFKACLFLGMGSVIYAMHKSLHQVHDHQTDAQDMRNMGGLFKKMPVTAYTFIAATLAICGIPLFSGFLSKDEILTGVFAYSDLHGDVALALPYVGVAVAFLTALYMGKLVFTVFFGAPKLGAIVNYIAESPKAMLAPLVLLALLSLWFWYGLNPVNPSNGWFMAKWVRTPGQVIPQGAAPSYAAGGAELSAPAPVTKEELSLEQELQAISPAERQVTTVAAPPMPHQRALGQRARDVALPAMLSALAAALAGLFVAWVMYLKRPGISNALERGLRPLHSLSRRKFFLDEIYDFVFVDSVLVLTRAIAWFDHQVIDRIVNATAGVTVLASKAGGWFDTYIVDGIVNLLAGISQFFGLLFRTVQTGRIQSYLGWTLASVVIMILLVRYFFTGV